MTNVPAVTGKCKGKAATIRGTRGDDVIVGTAGVDVIAARAGDDTIRGLGGNDLVCAGPGDDTTRDGCEVVRKLPRMAAAS